MAKSSPLSLSYHDGAMINRDLGYLLATADEFADRDVPHAVLLKWQREGGWSRELIRWKAVCVCVTRPGGDEVVVIGQDGEFLARRSGGDVRGDIGVGLILRSARAVEGRVYAVGMRGAVYRWDRGNWTNAAQGLAGDVELEALDGFGPNEMYVVGWNGALWRFNGKRWNSCELPVNLILTSVICAGDGYVYCAGQAGLLIRGRREHWEILEQDTTDEDFWGLEYYDGRLYVATSLALYTWSGVDLELVTFGQSVPDSCYHLSVADGALLSVGNRDCLLLTGSVWQRLAGEP